MKNFNLTMLFKSGITLLWFFLSISCLNAYSQLEGETESGSIFYVKTDGSDTNDGLTWENAFQTIQYAIDQAYADGGGEVWVAQGTYSPTAYLSDYSGLQTNDEYMSFIMYSGVDVYGGFAGTESTKEIGVAGGRQLASADIWDFANPTVLDGTGKYHTVWFGSTGFVPFDYEGIEIYIPNALDVPTTINGFTITGAFADEDIRFENTQESKEKALHASGGGAAVFGNGIISNCIVENNKARYGGAGIVLFDGGKAQDCLVHNNRATGINFYSEGIFGFGSFDYWRTDGAGILAVGSETTTSVINNCTISSNLGEANDNYPAAASSTNNKVNNGGGVYLIYSTIQNSLISSNNIVKNPYPYVGESGASCGGGIYLYSRGLVENCEVTDNGFQGDSQNGAGVWVADYGIYALAEDYDDLIVRDCYIHTNREGAALAVDSKYSTIESNLVANNQGIGIYGFGNCSNCRTVNCVSANNQSYGYGQSSNSNNEDNSLINSTIVNNGGSCTIGNANNQEIFSCVIWGNNNNPASISNATVNNSAFSFSPPAGTDNFQIDANNTLGPQFTSPSSGYGLGVGDWATADWSLQNSSPLIGQGDISLLPTGFNEDFAGNSRILGCEIEIGAYESSFDAAIASLNINGDALQNGYLINACSQSNVVFTFEGASSGDYPYNITWVVNDDPGNSLSGSMVVSSQGTVLFDETLALGTYEIDVISIEDNSGCFVNVSDLNGVITVTEAIGNIYYVKTTGSDSNDGLCWSTAFATVQHAIDEANASPNECEVWVAQGTYMPTEYITDATGLQSTAEYKSFIMYSGVNVYGGFFGNETTRAIGVEGGRELASANPWDFANPTILDGTGSYHVVWYGSNGFYTSTYEGIDMYIPSPMPDTTILDGFTITGGFANEDIRLENTEESKQKAFHTGGGGVSLIGNGIVTNCIVENNKARYGGAGIAMYDGAYATNCLVQNNEATGANFYSPGIFGFGAFDYWRTDGAGIVIIGSEDTQSIVDNCSVINNLGRANDNYPAAASANNNKVNNGGGVYVVNGILQNSYVAGNNIVKNPTPYEGESGASCGGGIYLYSRGLVDNCEVTDNGFLGDSQNGAGIWVADYGTYALAEDFDDLIVRNCYVHTNRQGVALAVDAQYSTIENNLVVNNNGLGIYGYGNCNNCRTVNCISANNQSYGYGHSTNAGNGNNSLINSTIVNNVGGCSIGNSTNQEISNSIIWGNNNNPATISNATVSNSAFSFTPPAGVNNIQIDSDNALGPNFVNPTSNYGTGVVGWDSADWDMIDGSPCIDQGDISFLPDGILTDINGSSRVMGCNIDMGAVETIHGDALDVNFTVNGNPLTPDYSETICQGNALNINFNEAISGSFPFTVSWEVNDDPANPLSGTTSVSAIGDALINAIPDAGTYSIQITEITDDNGCIVFDLNAYHANITVTQEPDVELLLQGNSVSSGSSEEICFGEAIVLIFENASIGDYPFTVSWTINSDSGNALAGTDVEVTADGQELINANPDPGTYQIEFISITDNNGCIINDLTVFDCSFTVNPEPEAEISLNGNVITTDYTTDFCYGEDLLLLWSDATAGTYPFTVSWTVNGSDTHPLAGTDVSVDAAGFELINNHPDAGIYEIVFTNITDANLCSSSNPSQYNPTVIVNAEPDVTCFLNGVANPYSEDIELCLGENIELVLNDNNANYPLNVSWTVNGDPLDPLSATDQTISAVDEVITLLPDQAGTFVFVVTEITDVNGCSVSDYSVYNTNIIVNPIPENIVVTATPNILCGGETSQLTATGDNVDHYDVYSDATNGDFLGTLPLGITPDATTSYFVEAISANGCSPSDRTETIITVNPAPGDPVVDNPIMSLCEGDTFQINATAENSSIINIYDANIGGNLLGTVPHSTNLNNDTVFYFEAVSTNGCVNHGGRTMQTVEVNPYPVLVISISDTAIYSTQTSQIIVSGADTYDWTPIDNLSCSTCSDPLFTAPSITTMQDFTFVVTGTTNSCASSDTAIITVLGDLVVAVPQAFSPNGDGTGDRLVISGLEQYPNNELYVFSRWGNEVYSMSPYQNEWEGKNSSDSQLPSGTYYYVLKLNDNDDTVLKGFVYIKY
ncbi:MAG: gliding motility-associated C-terminal domain-containing protein [Bacteroidales bacterium]|nr:gliding motility-associated C-terminal domain-containing protein [Bacteroidales bacterium]